MIPTINDKSAITRRHLLTYSGLAAMGLSVSRFFPNAQANQSKDLATILPSVVDTTITPSQDNPVRLNFNENALGMSTKARQAAVDAVPKANRYAKAEMPLLSQQLAKHHQVGANHILLTAGSSEGIRCTIEAFVTENTQFVIPELTYGDGEHFANVFKLKVNKVPCLNDWAFDIDGLKKAVNDHDGRSIVYLVNPNNPTSTVTPADVVEGWINSKPKDTIFIIDEAYAEFVNNPAFRSADKLVANGFDNVIVLKTFSKIHAMAGLRVGYVLAVPENIKNIAQYVAGEKLNYCGVCAALASMTDVQFLAYSKKATDVARQIMEQVLTELGFHYLPSETNFMFHQVPIDLAKYQALMNQHYVLIGRAFPPATQWCRISLGTPAEMLYVANVMRQLRQQNLI